MKLLIALLFCTPIVGFSQIAALPPAGGFRGKVEIREITKKGATSLYNMAIESDANYEYQILEGKWEKFRNDSFSILVDLEEKIIITINYLKTDKKQNAINYHLFDDSIVNSRITYDSSIMNNSDTGCLAYYLEPIEEINNEIDNSRVRQYCLKSAEKIVISKKKKASDFVIYSNGLPMPSANYKGFYVLQQTM